MPSHRPAPPPGTVSPLIARACPSLIPVTRSSCSSWHHTWACRGRFGRGGGPPRHVWFLSGFGCIAEFSFLVTSRSFTEYSRHADTQHRKDTNFYPFHNTFPHFFIFLLNNNIRDKSRYISINRVHVANTLNVTGLCGRDMSRPYLFSISFLIARARASAASGVEASL